jgi:mannosyltransferase OCH1-like enzyme
MFSRAADTELSFLDLPMFPPNLFERLHSLHTSHPLNQKTKIPKHLWFAVTNVTEISLWENVIAMREKNPDWDFHLCNNSEKDEFMKTYFYGSKIWWAYSHINPTDAAVARADIWRYAVLFVHGGVCKSLGHLLEKTMR